MRSIVHSQVVAVEGTATQHEMSRVPRGMFLWELEGLATKPLRWLEGCPVVLLAELRNGPRHVSSFVSESRNRFSRYPEQDPCTHPSAQSDFDRHVDGGRYVGETY